MSEREKYIISNTLRIGVIVASALVISGLIAFLALHPNADIFKLNTSELSLTDYTNPLTITLYGVIVLVSLPVLIVLEQVLIYSSERDKIYIIISMAVAIIMLFAILGLPRILP